MDLRVVLTICAVIWTSPLTVAGDLTCRRCTNAANLDDCTTNVKCSDQESCFMDKKITEQYTIEFTAGCRAKDVCSVGHTTPIGKRSIGKRAEQINCSSCCDTPDIQGCNTRLCGIDYRHGLNSLTQCYFCDPTHSGQGSVRRPEDCLTITTCQSNEVCYTQQQTISGTQSTWTYGCFAKLMCKLLMGPMLEDMRRCYVDKDRDACGYAKRSQIVCTVCCGDHLCNSGTCEDIKLRIYNLYISGHYDTTTLKMQ